RLHELRRLHRPGLTGKGQDPASKGVLTAYPEPPKVRFTVNTLTQLRSRPRDAAGSRELYHSFHAVPIADLPRLTRARMLAQREVVRDAVVGRRVLPVQPFHRLDAAHPEVAQRLAIR